MQRALPDFARTLAAVLPFLAGAVVLAGVTGCATTYEPKSPHIAVVRGVFHHGYMKDGVYYPGGWFGGRVGEAVKGVPEAERHTDAYATLSTWGSIGIFGSEGLGIGASVVHAAGHAGDTRNDVELGLVIGSAVALVTGITLHYISEHHLYDAANIYNDEIDRRKAAHLAAAATKPEKARKGTAFFTPWNFAF
jgi:hypothetical protein